MKTFKILALLCIILGFTSNNANAQVTHDTWAYSVEVTDVYMGCIDVTLHGTEYWTWFWAFFPDGGYKVQIKVEDVLVGTDGKNYTSSQIQNENWNPNKQNYVYYWSGTGHLMCEGKLVGLTRWTAHWTLPSNCEEPDWSATFERGETKCK